MYGQPTRSHVQRHVHKSSLPHELCRVCACSLVLVWVLFAGKIDIDRLLNHLLVVSQTHRNFISRKMQQEAARRYNNNSCSHSPLPLRGFVGRDRRCRYELVYCNEEYITEGNYTTSTKCAPLSLCFQLRAERRVRVQGWESQTVVSDLVCNGKYCRKMEEEGITRDVLAASLLAVCIVRLRQILVCWDT